MDPSHRRATTWLGYATLIGACLLAFRLLFLWLEYLYFWVNASNEVIAFAVTVVAHLVVRPRDNPRFRQITVRIVLVTVAAMAALLLIAFNLHIA